MPSSSYAKSKRSEVATEGVWGVRDVVGDGDGDESGGGNLVGEGMRMGVTTRMSMWKLG